MVASLLVAPDPAMSKAVPWFFSARGSTSRCLIASAVSHSKETQRSPRRGTSMQQVASKLKACSVFGTAAIACSTAFTLPFRASAASIEPSEELYRTLMVVGDLDPATAKIAIGITGPALSAFGFLFILRIVMSWYPKLPVTKFPYVIAYAPTEPFLDVTRKVIPPLGGVDVTPVVWFGLVSFLNEILVGPQGLLVLLSQQV